MEASGQSMPETKPIFEFNPDHPLLQKLDMEADEDRFAELVDILFDQANLAEGGSLTDPETGQSLDGRRDPGTGFSRAFQRGRRSRAPASSTGQSGPAKGGWRRASIPELSAE